MLHREHSAIHRLEEQAGHPYSGSGRLGEEWQNSGPIRINIGVYYEVTFDNLTVMTLSNTLHGSQSDQRAWTKLVAASSTLIQPTLDLSTMYL